jgi:hypothetical protein
MFIIINYGYGLWQYDIRLIFYLFSSHLAVHIPKSGQTRANIRYKHSIRYKSVINISIITNIFLCVDTPLNIVIPRLEPIKVKILSFVPVTVHVQLAMVQLYRFR